MVADGEVSHPTQVWVYVACVLCAACNTVCAWPVPKLQKPHLYRCGAGWWCGVLVPFDTRQAALYRLLVFDF
jgi:hypothetical protein